MDVKKVKVIKDVNHLLLQKILDNIFRRVDIEMVHVIILPNFEKIFKVKHFKENLFIKVIKINLKVTVDVEKDLNLELKNIKNGNSGNGLVEDLNFKMIENVNVDQI